MMPNDPVTQRRVQLQQVEQAKAQLASIEARTATTTECIKVLVEAGQHPESAPDQSTPLLIALCKVQLAQLRMAEAEGLAAIENLSTFIKRSESPLSMATLVTPPNAGRH